MYAAATAGNTDRRRLATIAIAGLAALAAWWFLRAHYGDPQAPVAIVPDRWRAVLAITDRDPLIRVELNINILRTRPGQPAMVALFPAGTVFRNAQIDGRPLVPVRQGDWHCAAIRAAGRFTITADLEHRPEHEAGVTRLRIRKPDFIQSLLAVTATQAWEVRVPGRPGRIVGDPVRGTHGMLQLGRGGEFTVEWREPRPAAERPGTASVIPSVAWTIGEKTLAANATLSVDILGGRRDQVTLLLPAGAGRVRAGGAWVRDTRLDGNRLTVFFRESLAGSTGLDLSFEVPRRPGETVTCPALDIEDGHAEAGGWIMVVNDSPGLLLENRAAGIQEASDLDIPAPVLGLARGKPVFFYKVTARGAEPVVDVVDRTPFPMVETIADRADLFVAVQPGGEEITRIRYAMRNHRRQFLRLNLPAGAELLAAAVDGTPCHVARDGAVHLVPLAKSIQTIGGLLPFAVEIVYCRQGAPVRRGATRRLDLPELPDVPVAAVKAVVFTPALPLKGCRSTLAPAGCWTTPDDLDLGLGRGVGQPSPAWVNHRLAREYYALGTAAYLANRLEDAEAALTEAVRLSPASVAIRAQAEALLDNLRAGRGEVNARADRAERAKIVTIRKALARENDQLQAQQELLIDAGLANIRSGREDLGAELLKQADAVGQQLSRRSASAARQQAVRRDYEQTLRQVQAGQEANEELQQRYTLLQGKVQQTAKDAGLKGRALAKGLLSAAKKRNLSVTEMQAPGADAAPPVAQGVTAGAEAQHIRSRLAANAPVQPPAPAAKPSASYESRNATLNAQVAALEEALSWAETAPAQADPPVDAKELAMAQALVARAEQTLGAVTNLVQTDAVTFNDLAAERELANLAGWVDVNRNTIGALDPAVAGRIAGLQERIHETGRKVEEARRRRQQAAFVDIPLAGNGLDHRSGREAFARFIATNYFSGAAPACTVQDGQLRVGNDGQLPEKLNRVVETFNYNGGRVVTVGGEAIPVSPRDVPVVNGWFSGQTGAGQRYALLDEAQFRVLRELAPAPEAGGAAGRPAAETKAVIVGTDNGIGGQAFTLVQTDADANRMAVGGTELVLKHSQYLALEDGSRVVVMHAGEVRDWQDEARRADLPPPAPRIELPATGTPVYFEKTLLSAGESPDIEMMF